MLRVKCPCCGYYTHIVSYKDELIFDICDVCFWQYDEVAHDKPNISIGANYISLNEARKNYIQYGVCKTKFKDMVRLPTLEEMPENNQ